MSFKNQCSPNKEVTGDFTCFSKSDLIELTNSYNSLGDFNLSTGLSKKKLFEQLSKTFEKNYNCDNEACWIEQEDILDNLGEETREELTIFTFKPKSPTGRYFILSTVDINLIMIQYELLHENLKFIGALPSDAFEISPIKKNVLIETIEMPTIEYVSIVFNLDKHNQPGSHWVSVFINKTKETIEYFDSLGSKPPRNIKKTLDMISDRYDYEIIVNDVIHQRGKTACGIYSIVFLLYKINYPDNYTYLSEAISDDKIHPFRKTLFRP
jgi:hypothetical protein